MRIPILAALSLGLIAAPAVAQNTDEAGSTDIASSVRGLSDTLSDPAMQAQAALMARAMSGVVLEMPVGPLARAAAEIAAIAVGTPATIATWVRTPKIWSRVAPARTAVGT